MAADHRGPPGREACHDRRLDAQEGRRLLGHCGEHGLGRGLGGDMDGHPVQRPLLSAQGPILLQTLGGLGLHAGVGEGQGGEIRKPAGGLALGRRETPRAGIAAEEGAEQGRGPIVSDRKVLEAHAEEGPRAEAGGEGGCDDGIERDVLDRQQGVGLGQWSRQIGSPVAPRPTARSRKARLFGPSSVV